MAPIVLTTKLKEQPLLKCNHFLECCETVPGEEMYIFEYNPESNCQSSEWHTNESPLPRKVRMSKLQISAMLIVFFDREGVIRSEFLLEGQTVKKEFYCEVLKRL